MDVKRGVTLRDLLTHRSGVTHGKYTGYPVDGPIPSLQSVLNGEPPATTPPTSVTSVPGTQFTLAAENYTVLQQIIVDQTSASFDSFMRRLLLDPLDMKRSFFASVVPNEAIPNAAVGHSDTGEPIPGGWRIYPEVAATGLWTTPSDFATFLCETLKAIAGRKSTLLSPNTARLLTEPITSDGEDGQAMGFGLTRYKGVSYLFKGGNTTGYYCHLDADPECGNAVVVFTNRNLCWQFANEVRDAVVRLEGFRGF